MGALVFSRWEPRSVPSAGFLCLPVGWCLAAQAALESFSECFRISFPQSLLSSSSLHPLVFGGRGHVGIWAARNTISAAVLRLKRL